jgi:hypothetical protein
MVNNLFFSKILFVLFICSFSSNIFLYWDNLPNNEQIELLQSDKIYKEAYDFYNGKLKVSDNNATIILLDSISLLSKDTKMKAFYFYLFNQVCLKSDEVLSEILGTYCQKVILSDIEYTMYYLKNNSNVSSQYIQLLGSEFYFKDNGTSDMQYNFNDFKRIVDSKLSYKKEEYYLFLSDFYKNIQLFIRSLKT